MKIAYSLFGAALVWLLIFPLSSAYSTYTDYQKNGMESDLITSDLKRYLEVVVPTTEVSERELEVGFIETLVVNAGFHLIHDPSLAQQVIVSGPTNVLDLITEPRFANYRYQFMFNQAVKLERPVEVRMNLNAHHVGTFRLTFTFADKEDNWTNFTALGPVTGHAVEIVGYLRTENDIQVDANKVTYSGSSCNPCEANQLIRLVGRADELALPNFQAPMDYAQLNVKTLQRTFVGMDGRNLNFGTVEKLRIIYNTSPGSIIENEDLVFRADTFQISRGTEMSVQYRAGNALVDTDQALIIRE